VIFKALPTTIVTSIRYRKEIKNFNCS